MKRQFFIGVFVAYTLLVSYLSLSAPDTIVNISTWDKIAHILAYTGFAVLAHTIAENSRQLLALLLFCVCFGIVIELLQGLTPERVSSVADVIANVSGLLIGTTMTQLALWISRKNKL